MVLNESRSHDIPEFGVNVGLALDAVIGEDPIIFAGVPSIQSDHNYSPFFGFPEQRQECFGRKMSLAKKLLVGFRHGSLVGCLR